MNKYSGALGRRYGTALFEILVNSSKSKIEFENHVKQIRTIFSCCSPKVIHYFLIASLTNEEKFIILEHFIKNLFINENVSNEISSFLKIMIVNKRFREVKSILYFFLTKSDEYLDIARATLITAKPILEKDFKDFELSINQSLNKKVVFKTELDESLKAGFIVKIGHMNIDASFKARLNSLKELFV